MDWPTNTGEFPLGDFQVQSGEVIRDARIVWKSYSTLSPQKDNVVLYPCSYGAKHDDMEWLVKPDGILDPSRWFVIIPNMFSNGLLIRRCRDTRLSEARHAMGQRAGAAPPAHRTVRHREAACSLWLLHGRTAGLSLGRDVSGRRGAHYRGVQQRAHGRAQQSLPLGTTAHV